MTTPTPATRKARSRAYILKKKYSCFKTAGVYCTPHGSRKVKRRAVNIRILPIIQILLIIRIFESQIRILWYSNSMVFEFSGIRIFEFADIRILWHSNIRILWHSNIRILRHSNIRIPWYSNT